MAKGIWQHISRAWQPAQPLTDRWPAVASGHVGPEGDDALIDSQVLGWELCQQLREQVRQAGAGGHLPTLLSAAGALAGYACQAAVRAQAQGLGVDAAQALHETRHPDGNCYVQAQAIDHLLLEDHPSLWSVLAAWARQAGVAREQLPNIGEMYRHVGRTQGTVSFGVMRLADGWHPQQPPQVWPPRLWPLLPPRLESAGLEPLQWPVAFALATRQLMVESAAGLPAAIALRVVMESALPASRMTLDYRPPAW